MYVKQIGSIKPNFASCASLEIACSQLSMHWFSITQTQISSLGRSLLDEVVGLQDKDA